jgi:hypothetical protein
MLPTKAVNNSMNAMQAIGAAISYGKRYTICGILNIATAQDDDNNGFAVNAKIESAKRPVSDKQLVTAIEQINNKERDLTEFLNRYDLNPQQLMLLGKELQA